MRWLREVRVSDSNVENNCLSFDLVLEHEVADKRASICLASQAINAVERDLSRASEWKILG
jgi:hypothetical protein